MSAPAGLVHAGMLLARSGEAAKSGPIGLAVILLLCICCYFLFKSMSKHLRTVREDFPKDETAPPASTPVRPTKPSKLTNPPTPAAIEPVRLDKLTDDPTP